MAPVVRVRAEIAYALFTSHGRGSGVYKVACGTPCSGHESTELPAPGTARRDRLLVIRGPSCLNRMATFVKSLANNQ